MNPGCISASIDIEGAFLQGRFENGKELYTEVPDGFEEYYSGGSPLNECTVVWSQASQILFLQDI